MDRREVLKLGVVGAGLGGSGCATLLANPGAVGASQRAAFLGELDASLARLGSMSLFDALLPATRSPELDERARRGEELAKKTLRSLLLVGTLQELPPEQLAHEDVQARLRGHMGEFDDAMFGATTLLEGLSPTEREGVGRALRDDPGLGMKVMGAIDAEAASFGISLKQRAKLRSVSSHACSRLRQSPELTFTEYAAKMRKLEAREGARAEAERRLAASVASTLLWDTADGEGGTVGGAEPLTPPPMPPPDEDVLAPVPTPPRAPQRRPRRKASPIVITAGAVALGVGATVFGIGFAMQGWALAIGITFGAGLGIIGLITLIVGLILLAAGK